MGSEDKKEFNHQEATDTITLIEYFLQQYDQFLQEEEQFLVPRFIYERLKQMKKYHLNAVKKDRSTNLPVEKS